MIEYIRGEITELTPTSAVVEASGVGYGFNISINTFTALQEQKSAKLWVHEAISMGGRDDSITLYGFATKEERSLFRLLLTVSGVGANTARMMLSSFTPADLCNAIASGDERRIKAVKGIGLKTAQRVIVDLKDKIPALGFAGDAADKGATAATAYDPAIHEEAVAALTMLGFPPAPSAKVVTAILTENPALAVEKVVREALTRIK